MRLERTTRGLTGRPWRRTAGAVGLLVSTMTLMAHAANGVPPTRTYELVAPEHQGAPTGVGPTTGPPNPGVWVNPKGDKIAYGSGDPFIGPSGLAPTFLSSRGTTAWSGVSMFPHMPQDSIFKAVNTVAISSDYQRVILSTVQPLSPEDTVAGVGGNVNTYLWDRASSTMTWISRSDEAGDSFYVARSPDARHILFTSTNSVTSDASGGAPKLYEWDNGIVRLVSVKPDGSLDVAGATAGSREELSGAGLALNAVSADGHSIFFSSPPPTASTPSDPTRVYVRSGATETREVSVSQCDRLDCNSPSGVNYITSTPDGASVFFSTQQQLLNTDTDETVDLYRYTLKTQALVRTSAGVGTLADTPTATAVLGVSEDGERVYYESANNALMLWDHGSNNELATFIDAGTSAGTQNCLQGDQSGTPNMTPDGKVLVFETGLLISPTFGAAGPGLYRYDAADNLMLLLAGSGTLPSAALAAYAPDCTSNTGVSENGDTVAFSTDAALVPTDVNAALDTYEWRNGQLNLVSSGKGDQPAMILGISQDARDVFFTTTAQLTPEDRDGVQDIYDARVNGFQANSQLRPQCSGEDCQSPTTSPQAAGPPGSMTFRGYGNRGPQRTALVLHAAHLRVRNGKVLGSVKVNRRGRLSAVVRARIGSHKQIIGRLVRNVAASQRIRIRLALEAAGRKALAEGHASDVTIIFRLVGDQMCKRVAVKLHV